MEQGKGPEMKKKLGFNLIAGEKHKGFGAGSIDLNSVACVIIDGDEAYMDAGAMHAKSKIEKRIKFSMNKEDVPNGRQCWIVWVAVDRTEEGAFYGGATACEMLIDEEARRGWKILADHVNKLDYALKRRYILGELGDKEKQLLKNLLIEHNEEWWNNSPETLQEALS
ncbi:YwhD family protein [Paenibacillus daejeonensis]|uniref:YwhD family protein n=1 Tax=Paenibacillus daejeonensis TaxID=135193 RepID=UPI00036E3CF3|nr:YwhD family protein [Paenibacillus daejeonensis]